MTYYLLALYSHVWHICRVRIGILKEESAAVAPPGVLIWKYGSRRSTSWWGTAQRRLRIKEMIVGSRLYTKYVAVGTLTEDDAPKT